MKIGPGSPKNPTGDVGKTSKAPETSKQADVPAGKDRPPLEADHAKGAETARRHDALMGVKPAGDPSVRRDRSGLDVDVMKSAATAALGDAAEKLAPVTGAITEAVGRATSEWQRVTGFQGVQINGPVATGGRLEGPNLGKLLGAELAQSDAVPPEYRKAVAAGVGEAIQRWQESVTVPGLPWYPSLAAHPGPVAPPVPNVPSPLADLAQNRSSMSASSLTRLITENLPDGVGTDVAKAIGSAVAAGFDAWHARTTVGNVLGGGNVPTFAPPYVPVGPVVAGDNIATPGHLIS